MKQRLIASLAIGVAVALGATGCNMVAPQATTNEYTAGDGVNIDMGASPLDVRNIIIIANDEGTEGSFLGAVVNDTDEAHTLEVTVGESGDQLSIPVQARSSVSFGGEDTPPVIENLNVMPGATVPVYFQAGDGPTVVADVPVMDGTLSFYAPFVP